MSQQTDTEASAALAARDARIAELCDWRDRAVASCAAKGCAMRERREAAKDAEIAKLRTVLDWCVQRASDGDIDGVNFQAEMQRLGLLVTVPASEEFRDEYDLNTMLVPAWHPLATGAK